MASYRRLCQCVLPYCSAVLFCHISQTKQTTNRGIDNKRFQTCVPSRMRRPKPNAPCRQQIAMRLPADSMHIQVPFKRHQTVRQSA